MKKIENILPELEALFQEVLEDNSIRLQATTTANDVADWDSVNHLVLLHAIEENFSVKFDLAEMIGFQNIGDIGKSILQKLGS